MTCGSSGCPCSRTRYRTRDNSRAGMDHRRSEAEPTRARLMRFLARIAKTATLESSPRKSAYADWETLTLDGMSATIVVYAGAVVLFPHEENTEVPMPKRTNGRSAAQRIYNEIVHRDPLAQKRIEEAAAFRRLCELEHQKAIAALAAEEARIAAKILAKNVAQEQFDELVDGMRLFATDVRFLAEEDGTAHLTMRRPITQEQARAMLEAAIKSGALTQRKKR